MEKVKNDRPSPGDMDIDDDQETSVEYDTMGSSSSKPIFVPKDFSFGNRELKLFSKPNLNTNHSNIFKPIHPMQNVPLSNQNKDEPSTLPSMNMAQAQKDNPFLNPSKKAPVNFFSNSTSNQNPSINTPNIIPPIQSHR